MKKLFISSFVCIASGFSASAFSAQGEYWEITTKMEMAGMPFAMPATTMKVCIAKGAERDPKQAAPSKDCEMTDIKVVGNKSSWKVRCNQNGEIMTGTGEISGSSDKSEGTIRLSGKSGGQAINMTQNYNSKRIGGSCDSDEAANRIRSPKEQRH